MSKNKLHITGLSGAFVDTFFRPLLKADLPLIGNVLKLLAKSALIRLGYTAPSAIDADIHEQLFGSDMPTLMILNEKMNDIMNMNKSFESIWFIKKRC